MKLRLKRSLWYWLGASGLTGLAWWWHPAAGLLLGLLALRVGLDLRASAATTRSLGKPRP